VKMCVRQGLGDIYSIGHVTDYSSLRILRIRRTYLRPVEIGFVLYFCSHCYFTRKNVSININLRVISTCHLSTLSQTLWIMVTGNLSDINSYFKVSIF